MKRSLWFPVAIVIVVGLWGFTRFRSEPARPPEHEHQPSPHGGVLISLGDDEYHVEGVFESGGTLRLFTLGRDETRVIDVPAESIAAYVVADGDTVAQSMTLEPAPQPGDAPGRTSQFIGKLPSSCIGRPVAVTIPSLRMEKQRFRVAFRSPRLDHHIDMPAKIVDADEIDLYLTPGGKYSLTDIEANGRLTASQKFRGFQANHDFSPKVGDRLCPITRTKANPQCTWIINGKRYEFCCPPCVDEFVRMAKERPEELKDPEQFVRE